MSSDGVFWLFLGFVVGLIIAGLVLTTPTIRLLPYGDDQQCYVRGTSRVLTCIHDED